MVQRDRKIKPFVALQQSAILSGFFRQLYDDGLIV
jgi:hypothetical protein